MIGPNNGINKPVEKGPIVTCMIVAVINLLATLTTLPRMSGNHGVTPHLAGGTFPTPPRAVMIATHISLSYCICLLIEVHCVGRGPWRFRARLVGVPADENKPEYLNYAIILY